MALLSLWEDLNPYRRQSWRKRRRYPLIEMMDELSELENFPCIVSFDGPNGKRMKLFDGQENDEFSMELEETKGYTPEELTVKVKGREVEIAGKHEERDEEGNCYVYREFRRSFLLPKNVDTESVASELSREGVLMIRASPFSKQKSISIPVEKEKTDKLEKCVSENKEKSCTK